MFGGSLVGFGNKGVALETDFISTWRTTTDLESITMCTYHENAYDCAIDWGDGTITNPTSWDDAGMTHEYAIAGDYTVRISGLFEYFAGFESVSGDNLISVINWGVVGWNTMNSSFRGCSNMTSFTAGNCDVSNVGVYVYLFFQNPCSSIDVSTFDTSGATTLGAMFLTSPALDIDPSNFNIEGITSVDGLNDILNGSGLTTAVYDALLVNWASQNTINGLKPHFGYSKYTLGSDAEVARNVLINDKGWTITDGGGI